MISQFTCTDDCWHSDWIGVIDGETAAKLAKRPKFLLNEAAESWRACKESVFGMPVHQQAGKQCDIAGAAVEEEGTMPGASPGFQAKLPTAGRLTCFSYCVQVLDCQLTFTGC